MDDDAVLFKDCLPIGSIVAPSWDYLINHRTLNISHEKELLGSLWVTNI